jgi:hypothetical protein
MATTTPNFGWPVPTSTDLVKDGATAIEALGDGIDASLLDLKGGTTGQVLAKASNTDLDYSWVTTDDTNAIQNAIVDAKGDLIAASAADTPARLAAGNNGESLYADSSATVGLRYSATPSASNPLLNSSYQVWQRGTSFAISAGVVTYVADRWCCLMGNTASTVSRQTTSDTTNLPFIQYCARLARNSGTTNTGSLQITQSLETVNSLPFAGKTVTMSYYARAGANFSSASNALTTFLITGTGTDQNHPSGYTGQATPVFSTATLTTTWQRFSFTATIAATATEIAVNTGYTPVGTAGANDYYEITGWQIDVGSVALPFRTYAGTIQGELAACQRYYYRNTATQVFSNFGNGFGVSTTEAMFQIKSPVTFRSTASGAIEYGTLAVYDGTTVTVLTNLIVTGSQFSADVMAVKATVASGLTNFRPYALIANNSTSAYLGYSAEL